MPFEHLLLLLAGVATVSLIVVLPWTVIRLTVGALEADASMTRNRHEHEQTHQPPDVAAVTEPSRQHGEAVDTVPPTATSDEDTDSYHLGGKG